MESNTGASETGLKPAELKTVADKANAIFKQLKEKYRGLSGYLVFASNRGQCELTTDMNKILKEFPAMVVESRQKEKVFELIKAMTELETSKKSGDAKGTAAQSSERAKTDLRTILNQLSLHEDILIEIRFKDPERGFIVANLDLIFVMQKDELVSRKHTPQTKASIRIVLGTLGELR
jgi:hypothetical protein